MWWEAEAQAWNAAIPEAGGGWAEVAPHIGTITAVESLKASAPAP